MDKAEACKLELIHKVTLAYPSSLMCGPSSLITSSTVSHADALHYTCLLTCFWKALQQTMPAEHEAPQR